MEKETFSFDEISKCSNVPPKNLCPWPAKTFQFSNCLAFTNKVPKYFSGDYRVDYELLKDDESIGGYQTYFYVINMINTHSDKHIHLN